MDKDDKKLEILLEEMKKIVGENSHSPAGKWIQLKPKLRETKRLLRKRMSSGIEGDYSLISKVFSFLETVMRQYESTN